MKTARMAIAALLGFALLQGCDRRESQGHSDLPPTQGTADQPPPEAPDDAAARETEAATPDRSEPDSNAYGEEDGG